MSTPLPHDERLARLLVAMEETRTRIERHDAMIASSLALLGKARAALERSRRVPEWLA